MNKSEQKKNELEKLIRKWRPKKNKKTAYEILNFEGINCFYKNK